MSQKPDGIKQSNIVIICPSNDPIFLLLEKQTFFVKELVTYYFELLRLTSMSTHNYFQHIESLEERKTMMDNVATPELRNQIHHLVELFKMHRMVYRKTIFH